MSIVDSLIQSLQRQPETARPSVSEEVAGVYHSLNRPFGSLKDVPFSLLLQSCPEINRAINNNTNQREITRRLQDIKPKIGMSSDDDLFC